VAFGGREARKLDNRRGLSQGQVQGMRNRLNYGPDFAGVRSGSAMEDGFLQTRHVPANTIGDTELASGGTDVERAVGNAHIQTDAVSQSKILNDAVGGNELAGGAVGSSHVVSGAIINSKIGDMDGGKLWGGSVDGAKLSNVNGASLLSNSVADAKIIGMSGGKLVNGSVTPNELDRSYAAASHNHDALYVNLTEVSKSTSTTLPAGQAWVITPTTSAI
jgi:hypothetical protein